MEFKNSIFNHIYEGGDKITPDINPKCGLLHWSWKFYKDGIGDSLVNPIIYGCSVKITQDINPIYVGIERSFPDDSKNVSFVNMGLV